MKDFPKTKLDKTVEVIDLFCGAGGLSFGLKKANIDIKAGIDLDAACAYPFTANNKSKFTVRARGANAIPSGVF